MSFIDLFFVWILSVVAPQPQGIERSATTVESTKNVQQQAPATRLPGATRISNGF
jgi:hypothetical protein